MLFIPCGNNGGGNTTISGLQGLKLMEMLGKKNEAKDINKDDKWDKGPNMI